MSYRFSQRSLPGRAWASVLTLTVVLILALTSSGFAMPRIGAGTAPKPGAIEPEAGTWNTWILASGDQFRLPAPPMKKQKAELDQLVALLEGRTADDLESITYWTAGSPAYRWNRIAVDIAIDKNLNSMITNRHLALLNTALEDAMIAAWDSKYAYLRERPSLVDKRVVPVIAVPNSPSYPSEDAVAAAVASHILAAIFPDRAQALAGMEEEAARAFVLSGVYYPTDVQAGLDLGHQIAEAAIAFGAGDGSTLPWTGTVPTDPTGWTGQNPALPQAATWRTYLLSSPDEFRPAAPFAYGSPELNAEMEVLRSQTLDPRKTGHAFFWEYGAGGLRNFWFWNDHLARMAMEYGLDDNAPRAARAYALMNVALYDATVSCWDAKYTYWAIRPFQYDPAYKTLFNTPNHPSYPSAHSCLSVAAADVLGYLFPVRAAEMNAYAAEAGEARVWAGLHFPNDIVAGTDIGHSVANKVIEYAQSDGSH